MLIKIYKLANIFYRLVITAGRKEDIQAKYPELDLSEFIRRDPSGNLKYLEWEAKILQSGKAMAPEICDVVELFDKYKEGLDKKDINQYDNFTELRDKLFEIRDSKLKEKQRYQVNPQNLACGSEVVYDSDNFTVRLIKNKEASMHFGLGTKWCVTMKNATYFEDYDSSNVIFHFIFCKKLDKSNIYYKIATAFQRDTNNEIIQEQYFLADDSEVYGWNELVAGIIHLDEYIDNFEKVEEELSEIIKEIYFSSKDQPKSILAKIASGEGTEDDFRKLYNTAKQTEDDELADKYLEIMFEQPRIPKDVLEDIIKNHGQYINFVAKYKYCPSEILESILNMNSNWKNNTTLENIIENPNLPVETLLGFLDNKEYTEEYIEEIVVTLFNRAEGKNVNDIVKIYNKIKNIKKIESPGMYRISNIKYAIAMNPLCPPEILDSMVDDDSNSQYQLREVVKNKNVSPETLVKIHKKWYDNKERNKHFGDVASDAFTKLVNKHQDVIEKHYPEEYTALRGYFRNMDANQDKE